MTTHLQSQNSSGLAPLCLPQFTSPTRVTETHWVKGEKYIACVHACMHASTQALSSWEQSGIQRPAHSAVWTEPWERERRRRGGGFKELQQLQCRSQRNMLKSGSTAHSPIHTYPQPLCRPPSHCIFPLSQSTLKPLNVTSYDCNLLSLWTLIFFASRSVLEMFSIGPFIS